jgi:pimeloyl-ACP methyl ester carboxylesterase
MKTEEGKRIYFPAHFTRSPDGTRIRYFDSGEPLPAIVLANGLGGPAHIFAPYVERWRRRYRVITWDYRGLYGSQLPAGNASLDVSAHCSDLRAIFEAAEIRQAAFFGWSMGVQVGLEFYSQNPNCLTHLTLINGTFGRPLSGVPLPFSGLALPPLVRNAGRLHRLGRRVLTTVSRSPLSYTALCRLGFLSPNFDRVRYHEMVRAFESVDLKTYLQLLSALHEHDGEKHLPSIRVPTLVITGERDLLTPPWLSRRIASGIQGAEFFLVPGGTHYSAAEYPHIVAARMELHLSRQGGSAA